MGKILFKNRLPFAVADDPEFHKACELMRPGIGKKLLGRKDLAGKLLDEAYEKVENEMAKELCGKMVALSQDGWSNVHREPIIATCLHLHGKSLPFDAVEVGAETKTAEYCAELAKKSILTAEQKYGCKVVGFVSENEKKMKKVRRILQEWRQSLLVYGCSAHCLNLVENDAIPSAIKNSIMEVQRYFRNNQKPAALLKEAGGKIPQLPK